RRNRQAAVAHDHDDDLDDDDRRPGRRHAARGPVAGRRDFPAPLSAHDRAGAGGLRMALVTLDDRTPTSAKAIEAHYWALDPRIRAKRAALEAQRDAHHAIVDALRLKLHALREDLVVKRRRLGDAIASATPARSRGESDPRGAA